MLCVVYIYIFLNFISVHCCLKSKRSGYHTLYAYHTNLGVMRRDGNEVEGSLGGAGN